jgi:hypothetical protein
MARPIIFRLAEVRNARGKSLGVGPSLAGQLPLNPQPTSAALNNYTLTADPGAVAETGVAAALLEGHALPASAAAYAESGIDATLKVGYRLTAAVGTFTETGIASAGSHGYVMTAGAGSFTETGVAAALKVGYVLTGLALPSGIDTASDLVGATTPTFNATHGNESLSFSPPGGATNVVSLTVNQSTTRNMYLFGPAGWPNRSAWPADGFTVKAFVQRTSGSTTANVRAFVGRVNAAGVLQEESTASASVTVSVLGNLITFAVPSMAWAAGAASDRLYVRLLFTQGPTSAGTFTIKLGAAAGAAQGCSVAASWLRDPAERDTIALSGVDAALSLGYRLTAANGSFTLTGIASLGARGYSVPAAAAAFTFTGKAANILAGYRLTCAAGAFTQIGQDAAPRATHILSGSAGSYTMTGVASTAAKGQRVTAAAGSFALTGQSATIVRSYALAAGAGTYALTGKAAALSYSGATGLAYVLTADPGSYALTGADAALIATASPAQPTVLSVGGTYAIDRNRLRRASPKTLPAESGRFRHEGTAARLTATTTARNRGASHVGLAEFVDANALIGV